MDLTFLAADRPLTKTFALNDQGLLTKNSAPMVFDVTSHTVQIYSISDLHGAISAAAARGWCLLKGNPKQPLVTESRAGSTDASSPTTLVCADLDGALFATPDEFMQAIGLPDTSYVLQWSSSHGIDTTNPGLRCHIFFFLSTALLPEFLKRWLRTLNLSIQPLANALELTASGLALRWTLDITTCQNDKLIYIAPPVLGPGLSDPHAGNRILLVTKEKDTAEGLMAWSEAKLRDQQDLMIEALRTRAGLPRHKLQLKQKNDLEYMDKANAAVQWEAREARGFTYFNLNGGDSWAYYHPRNNPVFIYNFKGEPAYLTSELLPDYWEQLRQRTANLTPDANGKLVFGLRERLTSLYYSVEYDTASQELRYDCVKNEPQLRAWLLEQGAVPPQLIPTWEFEYSPCGLTSSTALDPQTQHLNTFVPSRYMLGPQAPGPWPTIDRIITHVFGPACRDAFLNWIACAYQLRTIIGTSWIAQGVQGTGKGVLQNLIIAPLFGRQNVSFATLHSFEAGWTDFLEDRLIIVVDEMNIEAITQASKAMALIKNAITEPTIQSRRKYAAVTMKPNHANMVFFSNMPIAIEISQADRRFNVGEYQRESLVFANSDVDAIASELEGFASFLEAFTINRDLARTPLLNEARVQLMERNMSSADLLIAAIKRGDLPYLVDQLPDDLTASSLSLSHEAVKREAYVVLMKGLVLEPRDKLTRSELHIMFAAQAGNIPPDGIKFSHYLNHHDLRMSRIWINDRTVAGVAVHWHYEETWIEKTRTWLNSTQRSSLKSSLKKSA